MEFNEKNNVKTIKFGAAEFDLVRLTFFKRNTQESLLLKEVLSFVRPCVQSVEVVHTIDYHDIEFRFFLPFNKNHHDIHRLFLDINKWEQHENYSIGLYYEDKTTYHFINLVKAHPAQWNEENGYLRHTFSKQIKLTKLHKFLSVVIHAIGAYNQ